MTGLLPDRIRDAIANTSVFAASKSFGVVALSLLVMLLLERETLRMAGFQRGRLLALTVVSAPLLIAVALTIVARFAIVIH